MTGHRTSLLKACALSAMLAGVVEAVPCGVYGVAIFTSTPPNKAFSGTEIPKDMASDRTERRSKRPGACAVIGPMLL